MFLHYGNAQVSVHVTTTQGIACHLRLCNVVPIILNGIPMHLALQCGVLTKKNVDPLSELLKYVLSQREKNVHALLLCTSSVRCEPSLSIIRNKMASIAQNIYSYLFLILFRYLNIYLWSNKQKKYDLKDLVISLLRLRNQLRDRLQALDCFWNKRQLATITQFVTLQ